MALELYVDGYCGTCGDYKRLKRLSLMCDPCSDSWRAQVIERRWSARNETSARPGKTDMGHQTHRTAIQITLRIISCLLAAVLVATAVWLVIMFSQSSFSAPELNTPSFCHVPAVRDGLGGSLRVFVSSVAQKLGDQSGKI
jgi:hypothetical protein